MSSSNLVTRRILLRPYLLVSSLFIPGAAADDDVATTPSIQQQSINDVAVAAIAMANTVDITTTKFFCDRLHDDLRRPIKDDDGDDEDGDIIIIDDNDPAIAYCGIITMK